MENYERIKADIAELLRTELASLQQDEGQPTDTQGDKATGSGRKTRPRGAKAQRDKPPAKRSSPVDAGNPADTAQSVSF